MASILAGEEVANKSHYREILESIGELNGQIARIDERTRNIWVLTEKQEAHLSKLNGSILELWKQTVSNKTSIFWIKLVLISSGIIGGTTAGIINLLG